jgi:hypothetical protein
VNYLIIYENSVFVAKQDPRVIMQQIQMIEMQKPMLSGLYTNASNIAYCRQVLDVLENDFVQGFTKIENYKQSLRNELTRVPVNDFYATLAASNILIHLKLALPNACPFDALPHCNIPLSLGRDTLIQEVCKAANNSAVTIIGQILSLAFKIKDMNKVGQMFWFYNTIIAQIGQNPQYENERNLLNWAKGQRAYAYLAMATTVIGGAANVAHIISETSAQRDIEQYGQQTLIFL